MSEQATTPRERKAQLEAMPRQELEYAAADAEAAAQRLARDLGELRRKHQYKPAPGTYLVRTTEDAQGNSLGERQEGEYLHGYRSRDTGEMVWVGTFTDVFAWAGERTGIEPLDRHQAYWERRYAARRYARRVGTLPTYSDLWQEHVQAISLMRDLVRVLHEGLEPDQAVLDKVREQYMYKPLVYDQERV